MFLTSTLLAFALAISRVSADPSLSLKVTGAEAVVGVENLSVTATVTNTGDETLKLFKDPRGALSSFKADTFSITSADGSSSPKFQGAKVKYSFDAVLAANKEDSFVVLAPGASISVDHELVAYNFTNCGEGAYNVEASNVFNYVDANGKVNTIYAKSEEAATTNLSGSLSTAKYLPQTSNVRRRASYVGCTSSRQSSIATALTGTTTYVSNALTYLSGISSGTTRYTTWFGTYTSSRKSTVQSHYTNIQSNTPTAYTYDCTCTDDYYAYVYPDTFGYIYLCNAFWTAPTTGTDSKAGTIVHESSHFTRNGGTDDYAYGQSACKSLATSSPASAIMNADSHEYFAENNPALS